MSRKRRNVDEEETTYWLSYSDMMAALLLIFVLIITLTMLEATKKYEEDGENNPYIVMLQNQIKEYEKKQKGYEEEIVKLEDTIDEMKQAYLLLTDDYEKLQEDKDRLGGIEKELVQQLCDEFNNSDMEVTVDNNTGVITFDSSVLFDVGKFELKDDGKRLLDEFMPKYLNIIFNDKYKEVADKIIVEGHTDDDGSYLYNLELSQKRADSVVKYCLNGDFLTGESKAKLEKYLSVNARSYSEPIIVDNKEDKQKSRRVEIKFSPKNENIRSEFLNK